MIQKYSKRERLKYHASRQDMDSCSDPANPTKSISSAVTMQEYERQAKIKGMPVSRVIAEVIC